MIFSILIAGFGGGMIRGLIGFIKHQYAYKNVKFDLPYFFAMCFLSGTIGLLTAAAIEATGAEILGGFSPGIAFVIGYAGGDFIENIAKILLKKESLNPFKKHERPKSY